MSQLMKQFFYFFPFAAASCTSEPITKSWVFVSKVPRFDAPVTQDRIFFDPTLG